MSSRHRERFGGVRKKLYLSTRGDRYKALQPSGCRGEERVGKGQGRLEVPPIALGGAKGTSGPGSSAE